MARIEMLRPDHALCLLLRTITPQTNLHENAEYQTILSAVKELKRLYTMEMFVNDLLKHLPSSVTCDNRIATDIDMIEGYLDEWNYLEKENDNE